MQPVLNANTFIFLITVVLCFLAASVLLVFSRNKIVNNRWLAGYYIVTGYGLLVAFLLYSRLITVFPWYHTYRTGYVSAFLLMPLSFFYIRSLMQQKKFSPIDLIHFLPVTIFIIDFIPFYFRSADYKLQQLAIDAQGLNTIWNEFSQGWLGIGFVYVPLRIALTVVYWVWQVRMIIHSGKMREGQSLVMENKDIMLWAKIFCGSQLLFFVPYYLNAFFGSQQNFFFVIHTLLAIGISITIAFLIMQPHILYGLKGVVIRDHSNNAIDNTLNKTSLKEYAPALPVTVVDNKTAKNTEEGSETYFSAQKLENMAKQLTNHVVKERSYLKRGCTTAKLAAEMNMQPYLLSAVINQVFKTNFNDFLNGYRVEHAKTLIQSGETRLLTLEALSEQCGFNNRNSFTLAFKKHTGQTPSDFIKKTHNS